MEYTCKFASGGNYIPCQRVEDGENQDGICIYPEEVCDGIPQCPNATDEALDTCRKYFSSAAQVECQRPNVQLENGMTVPTLAIRCNGIVECADGQDELNCKLSTIILYTVLLPGLLIICVTSYCVLSKIPIQSIDELHQSVENISFDCDEINLRYKMMKVQTSLNRQDLNQAYFQFVLEKHGGKYSKALNEIKVCLQTIKNPFITSICFR